MRHFILSLGVLMLVVVCSGCATTVRGTQQKIKFVTDPAGANVQIASGKSAAVNHTTPVELKLSRNQEHRVVISKAGYQPIAFTMKGQFDGTSLVGVALPGGSAMLAADRVSGADMAFWSVPRIKLVPVQSPATRPLEMYQYKDELYTKEELEKIIRDETQKEVERDRT